MLGAIVVLIALPAFVALQVWAASLSTRKWSEADWQRAYDYQDRIARHNRDR